MSIESRADAWRLRIEQTPSGARVVAYPKHFFNGRETDKVFASDAAVLWNELFDAIGGYLPPVASR